MFSWSPLSRQSSHKRTWKRARTHADTDSVLFYALDFIRENITILKWKSSSFDFEPTQNSKRELGSVGEGQRERSARWHKKRQRQSDTHIHTITNAKINNEWADWKALLRLYFSILCASPKTTTTTTATTSTSTPNTMTTVHSPEAPMFDVLLYTQAPNILQAEMRQTTENGDALRGRGSGGGGNSTFNTQHKSNRYYF